MTNKITAIIQARLGSTRLPGKVLKPIAGKPLLWHIVNRLKSVNKIDEVVIATSNQANDNKIKDFCASENITCFRGSENDVLDRFYKAALSANAGTVIRITGDCPLIDPNLIGKLIDYFFEKGFDFCGIAAGAGVAKDGFVGRYPDGLDAEIFLINALKIAWQEARGLLYREHVTPFIWKQPKKFKLGTLKSEDKDYSDFRWTIDNEEDYRLIQWIYEKLFPTNPNFNMYDVLRLLSEYPEKLKENKHFIGKEGYEKFKIQNSIWLV